MRVLTLSPFLLTALALACAGSRNEARSSSDVACPSGQTFDGQYCQVDQNVASAETPAPTTTTAPPEAGKASNPVAASGGTTSQEIPSEEVPAQAKVDEGIETTPVDAAGEASPVDITMAAQAAPVIQYLASSHLPSGARQLGAPFAGQFAEGQVLSQKLQVVEGKCYTVVAVAMPPVRELNVLLFQEGIQRPLAEDVLTGTQAVIGSRDSCYRALKSESLELVLRVEKGNGVAAGQVFQK